jgi:hypothetical protein
VREMRYPYYFGHNGMGDPIWLDDGKYVLAETSETLFGGNVFGIWNAESGKFRGGLSGCAHLGDQFFPFAPSGGQMLCWARENELVIWDVTAAIDKITEFDSSLTRTDQR